MGVSTLQLKKILKMAFVELFTKMEQFLKVFIKMEREMDMGDTLELMDYSNNVTVRNEIKLYI